MSENFKKSGKLSYMPQYNYDNRKSEAPIIEVKKPQNKKPCKIDKSKVVTLAFRVIYLVIFAVTAVALYKATNGVFLLTESYSEIHNSIEIAGGAAVMLPIIFVLERLVTYYVKNFMD